MEFGEGTLENLGMRPEFWKNKKVLITGHTGFKGSWLSLWLQKKGAHVIGYALTPPTEPNMFGVADVARKMISITGDVRNLACLRDVFNEHQPEIVFHLAAQAIVRRSYENPAETYETNIMGTVNVLEAIRNTCSVRSAVMITSDKCYENREWVWGYRESDMMGGHDPYSSSKGCAELVISAYRRSYFSTDRKSEHCPSIASTRAGNVVGGGDWAPDRLIPDILRAFMKARPVIIRNPKATRPWQHVLEPLRGYLMLAEQLWYEGDQFSGGWNFGPNEDDNKPVARVADRLSVLWSDEARWEKDATEQPHEANYLKLDCSKSKALLKWRPLLNLDTTLTWIVDWYKAYQKNEDMNNIAMQHIARYERLIEDAL